MSKSRLTYRFEPPRDEPNMANKAGLPSGRVIPLYEEEFRVVEDQQEIGQREEFEPPVHDVGFDHKGHSGDENLVQFTRDFGEWQSPFDTETRRIEQLIREADQRGKPDVRPKTASSFRKNTSTQDDSEQVRPNEAPPYDFEHLDIPQTDYYDLPKEQIIHLNYRDSGPNYSAHDQNIGRTRMLNRSRSPWTGMVFATGGAIATGLLLGFFVLNIFFDGFGPVEPQTESTQLNENPPVHLEVDGQNTTQPLPNSEATTPIPGALGDSGAERSAAAGSTKVHKVEIQLPERSFSFLQIGVFSTLQGAETIMQELGSIGLAAVMEPVGANYAVFAGVATHRDHALLLSSRMDSSIPEVYAKAVTLPQIGTANWIGTNPEALANYLKSGNDMLQQLIQLSIVHINEAKPSLPDQADLLAIKLEHKAWTTYSSTIGSGASDIIKPTVQKMNTALNTAMVSLEEYTKSPSVPYLWQIQSSIMQYIVAEKQFISVINAT